MSKTEREGEQKGIRHTKQWARQIQQELDRDRSSQTGECLTGFGCISDQGAVTLRRSWSN